MKTLIDILLTVLALASLWNAAEISNDRLFYVAFGACLMVWPCQWAFRLGQRSIRTPRYNPPEPR